MKLKPIILGGNDAWKIAAFLKEKNVPVIFDGVLDLPRARGRFLRRDVRERGETPAGGRALLHLDGRLRRGGAQPSLPRRDGRRLRTVAARRPQIGHALPGADHRRRATRLGSIEVGKIANLVVSDGDLLEARTHIRHLFINGRQVPLDSRHTELYEQFRNRK